jgi:hypothetical protein
MERISGSAPQVADRLCSEVLGVFFAYALLVGFGVLAINNFVLRSRCYCTVH